MDFIAANTQVFTATNSGSIPASYSCRFIEPGLVNYSEYGNVLVTKNTLDGMMNSMRGCPVVITHTDTVKNQDAFKSGEADGIVSKVWYNAEDGWYWADFMVWNQKAVDKLAKGYSVSCFYRGDIDKKAGEHNNISYSGSVINGQYQHLALVENPRYEGAFVIKNSKGGIAMRLMFWKDAEEAKEVKNGNEIDVENVTTEIDGKKVPLKNLIEAYNKKEAEKATDESLIEINGKKVSIKELKNSYASTSGTPATSAEKVEVEETKTESNDEELKKLENALSDSKKAQKEAEENFNKLKNAREQAKPKPVVGAAYQTREDKVAAGKEIA